MRNIKMIVSFVLCLSLVLALSVTAFAALSDGSEIMPCVVQIHYINGSNINFRSGASLQYSSAGYVHYPERCEPKYKNGSSYFMDEYGCTDENGNVYEWRYIHMTQGSHAGENGYVVSRYVTSNWVNADS